MQLGDNGAEYCTWDMDDEGGVVLPARRGLHRRHAQNNRWGGRAGGMLREMWRATAAKNRRFNWAHLCPHILALQHICMSYVYTTGGQDERCRRHRTHIEWRLPLENETFDYSFVVLKFETTEHSSYCDNK